MKSIRQIIREEIKIIFEGDKMSSIDLDKKKQKYRDSDNTEWLEIIERFPETLQREIIDERPNGDFEAIDELKNWELLNDEPIKVSLMDLLDNKENINSITRISKEAMDIIKSNPKYKDKLSHIKHISNTDVGKEYGLKPGEIFDSNPNRYLEYAKLSGDTAKPSVVVNGIVHWGNGRFIAALLRGDEYLKVWNIKS